jgi:hypothetical protein
MKFGMNFLRSKLTTDRELQDGLVTDSVAFRTDMCTAFCKFHWEFYEIYYSICTKMYRVFVSLAKIWEGSVAIYFRA